MEPIHTADLLAAARAIPLPPSPPPTSPATATPPISMDTTQQPHSHIILAEFWPTEPVAWFRKAEAQFRSANIFSSQQKYDYVLAKLPTDVLVQLLDLMEELDDNPINSYERLKERLIKAYVPSKWAKAPPPHQTPTHWRSGALGPHGPNVGPTP